MPESKKTAPDRRGAALIMVLVFGAGALMLASTMLLLSRSSVVDEFEHHRGRQLQAVLKAGVAAAVNEVNRARRQGAAYVDPEGNGPGAIGGADRQGRELLGPTGVRLGRYRTLVERGSTRYGAARDILVVAAAWPDFTSPRRVAVAEVELERQALPIGANAVSIHGEYDKTKDFFKIDKKSNVSITAPDADVPAVDIGSMDLHTQFVNEVVPELLAIEGADRDSPGTLVSGAATVDQRGAGVLSEETLQAVRADMEQRIADLTPTATPIVTIAPGADVTLPAGVYRMPSKLVLGSNTRLRGSGTLIVENDVQIKSTAKLEWDGDVIIIEDEKAKLTVENNGTLTQAGGVVAVISDDASAKTAFKKKSNVTLGTAAKPSALAIIAGNTKDTAKFSIEDLELTVYGIVTLMGSKKVELKFEDGSLDVIGSLSLALANPLTKDTELKLEVDKKSDVEVTFDRTVFDGALVHLGSFLDPKSKILPVTITMYWEPSTAQVLAVQEGVMGSVPFAGWGAP